MLATSVFPVLPQPFREGALVNVENVEQACKQKCVFYQMQKTLFSKIENKAYETKKPIFINEESLSLSLFLSFKGIKKGQIFP